MAKTAHHPANRKRYGHHQKRSSHFMKAYHPFLPVLFIGLITTGFVMVTLGGPYRTGSQQKKSSPGSSVLAYATNINANALLSATNQRRTAAGLGSLNFNSRLNQAAQAKANDMTTRNYWAHNTPEGTPPWTFIANAGYSYDRAGENLACGFNESSEVITGWYNSPSHRDNLLHTEYTEVGFGLANAAGYNCGDFAASEQTVVVALYATPYTAPVAASQQPETPAPTTPSAVNAEESSQSTAQQNAVSEHTVVLTVTNLRGDPEENMKVSLHSDPMVGYTDKKGIVTFKNVPTGKHTIIIEVHGARTETALDLTNAPAEFALTVLRPELAANQTSRSDTAKTTAPSPKKVSRIDLLTSANAQLVMGILIVLTLLGVAYVGAKHSVAAHRFFVKGEQYVFTHIYIDIAVVLLLIALYFLTRSVGAIL